MSKFQDGLCQKLYRHINLLVQGIEEKPFYENEVEQLEMMFKLSSLSPYFGKWIGKNKEAFYKSIRRTKRNIAKHKKELEQQ